MLRTFSFFIEDRRYSAPTLRFAFLRDEREAREVAAEELAQSANHLAVEVHEAGQPLFRQDRAAG